MPRISALASLALVGLFAISGCVAPSAALQEDKTDASPSVETSAAKGASSSHHVLVLGSHADIAVRRLSVAPKYAHGVSTSLEGAGPAAYIPSSATYFANAKQSGGLGVTLVHDSVGTLLTGATSVVSVARTASWL